MAEYDLFRIVALLTFAAVILGIGWADLRRY